MALISRKATEKGLITYIGEFDTLVSRAGITNDKQKLQYFMKGLPKQYTTAMLMLSTNMYSAAQELVRNMKTGQERLGIMDNKDPNAMDIDQTKINAVTAQKTGECFYCGIKGHWAKDCRKKQAAQGQGQGPSTNGVSLSRGNHFRGRGRGSFQRRGKSRNIRALTNGEDQEEEYQEEEQPHDLTMSINAVLNTVDDNTRDQIIHQLSQGF